MTGNTTDVVDHYQQMAMGGEETYHLNDDGQKSAMCSHISFTSTNPDEAPRTG